MQMFLVSFEMLWGIWNTCAGLTEWTPVSWDIQTLLMARWSTSNYLEDPISTQGNTSQNKAGKCVGATFWSMCANFPWKCIRWSQWRWWCDPCGWMKASSAWDKSRTRLHQMHQQTLLRLMCSDGDAFPVDRQVLSRQRDLWTFWRRQPKVRIPPFFSLVVWPGSSAKSRAPSPK